MDKFSKKTRSKIMSAIHSKHTVPEVKLRKALRKRGLKYRLHYGKEKIDVAFPGKKIAIFVDGCFWHQCPIHSHKPKSNQKYWLPKLKRNKVRAEEKDRRLKNKGWKTVHIWEHELAPNRLQKAIGKIKKEFAVLV